jgi:hypothetical protein
VFEDNLNHVIIQLERELDQFGYNGLEWKPTLEQAVTLSRDKIAVVIVQYLRSETYR